MAGKIPLPSVSLTDRRTGQIERTWYDYFEGVGQPEKLQDYPNDVQAAAGGVPLYGLYRSGSVVKVRVT